MSRKAVIFRLVAEVPDEAAAATVGNGLLARLWTFGILYLQTPVRYWKVGKWPRDQERRHGRSRT